MTNLEGPPPEDMSGLLNAIRLRLEDIGLYVEDFGGVQIQTVDPSVLDDVRTAVADHVPLRISLPVTIGQIAWSDRVLDPQQFQDERDFKLAAPTENEIFLAELRDNMESGNPFGELEIPDEDES